MRRFPDQLRSGAPDVLLRCITSIEAFYSQVEGVHRAREAQFDLSPPEARHAFAYIGEMLWLLYGVYIAKYFELVGGVIGSVIDEEFLVFGLCGRSLIETTAMLRYYQQDIVDVAKNATNPDAFSEDELRKLVSILDSHSRGGRFDWVQFYSSDRQGMAEKLIEASKAKGRGHTGVNPRQVNAMTAVDRWARSEPWVMLSYEFFCELVHPNLGSTFLVMGAGDAKLAVGGTTEKSVGKSLCIEGIKLLAPVLKEASLELAKLVWFAGTTRRE